MSPEVAPAARDAVISAYYPTALQAAESARTRAQAAYTIASAVAAAIVAGGIFGDIGAEPPGIQILGVATLAVWLLAAILFIHAITSSVVAPNTGTQPNVDDFVNAALDNASSERSTVVSRQKKAYITSVVAILMTLALVIALLIDDPDSESIAAKVSVTAAGKTIMESVCPEATDVIHGEIDPTKLGSAFVAVKADAGICADEAVEVRLPRSSIAAVVADPPSKPQED